MVSPSCSSLRAIQHSVCLARVSSASAARKEVRFERVPCKGVEDTIRVVAFVRLFECDFDFLGDLDGPAGI